MAAPWACDRSGRAPVGNRALVFDRVVSAIREVRAGRLGIIAFGHPCGFVAGDPLFGPAQTWESRAAYRPTRHPQRGKDPSIAVVEDAMRECERRGLPVPEVELLELESGPKGGNLAARIRLTFTVAVEGPLMLGRDSHMGGGLFAAADDPTHARRPAD